MTVKDLRKQAGLTLAEVGKAIGVGTSAVGNYECGKNRPRLANLRKLAQLYGVSMEELSDAFENQKGEK